MNIALFHDFLVRMGGAEYVLSIFQEMFPEAEIHTVFSNRTATSKLFGDTHISTNKGANRMYDILSHIPFIKRFVTKLFIGPMPRYIDDTDLSSYDLVIANSGAWGHGLITSVHTHCVVYMHSPMRFVWDSYASYKKQLGARNHYSLKNIILTYMLGKTRKWDQLASWRENILICNSLTVQKRIKKYYKRDDSTVLYPPVAVESILAYPPQTKQDFYLLISTFTAYKHIDIAIRSCEELRIPLVIVGDGPEREFLQSIAGPHTTFAGKVQEEKKIQLLHQARAVIQVSEEDFGIVPVESMAAGTPVIGFGRGGITELIEHEKTGILFEEQSQLSLQKAISAFMVWEKQYDPLKAREEAKKYDVQHFKKSFMSILHDHGIVEKTDEKALSK